MPSFHPTDYLWIAVAYLYCESYAQRLRPNPRPTPATDLQTASLRQSSSPCDRRSSSGLSFGPCESQDSSPCDRPSLPQCKTPSLRRESAKRSAYLHPSQKPKRLTRSSRKTMRYRLGFFWGLWLPVAVQNMIRNSPQRMPSAERSFIPSCPTSAAGATA